MAKQFAFNPLTGNLDLINVPEVQTEVEVALKVAEEFDCVEPASIGDLVVVSQALPETVVPITSNVYDDIVLGIIISKPMPGRAKILISGKLVGSEYQLAGLFSGKALYVGTNGKVTTTAPLTGHIQRLGVAIKSDRIYLNISLDKTVRT